MDKISVVVPCYNEEEALPVYYKEMCRVMDEMKDVVFELIFVDDGSSDATLGIMKDLNEKDSRCRYLSFSRNFGKDKKGHKNRRATYPFFPVRKLLQICQCYFKDRDCRWSERLPADEAEDGAGSSGNERV